VALAEVVPMQLLLVREVSADCVVAAAAAAARFRMAQRLALAA